MLIDAPAPVVLRQRAAARAAEASDHWWADGSIADGLAYVCEGWAVAVDGTRRWHVFPFLLTDGHRWLLVPHPAIEAGLSDPTGFQVARWWADLSGARRRECLTEAVAAAASGTLVDLSLLVVRPETWAGPGMAQAREAVRAALWTPQGAEQRAALAMLVAFEPIPGAGVLLRRSGLTVG